MPTMKMTKTAIANLKAPDPSGKQQLYWATPGGYPGLGILVSGTTTTRTWVVQAKVKGTGKAVRVTLAPVPVLSLEQAWAAAQSILTGMHAGKDPRVKEHQPAKVSEALDQYLKNPKLREKTKADYRNRVKEHLAGWMDKPIASITPNMCEERFLAITGEVEARRAAGKSRGGVNVDGRATANLVLSVFRSLWRDQRKRDPAMVGLLEPAALLGGKWHELKRRERFVEPEQMPAFFAGIQALESRLGRDLLSLALFTGWREMEICALRWSELDLQERVVRIPGARMKSRKDFELPMSRQVADLLIARRALGRDGDYVFPGAGEKHPYAQSMQVSLRAVGRTTGIAVSPHDLRRTFISIAENCTITPFALKRLVAHTTSGDVTSGYVQKTREQLREAAQVVADRIDELCGVSVPEGVERLVGSK